MPTPKQPAKPDQRLAVDENTLAEQIGLSVHWLRKDRRGRKLIPFFKIGSAVRYSLERVREALAQLEEGGARKARGQRG